MIMADVFAWLFIVIGTWLVLQSYWMTAFALFPRTVTGCAARYGRRPVLATLLGLVVFLPLLLIGAGAAKVAPPLGVLFLIPLLLALLGSAGLALRIGDGLPAPADAVSPWRRVARGGGVLAFTFLLPFLGWFVVLPWALTSGLGTAIMTLLSGSEPLPVATRTDTSPEALAVSAEPRPA